MYKSPLYITCNWVSLYGPVFSPFSASLDKFPNPIALYSMLTSQGVFLATAMAVSAGSIILFDLFREKYFPSSQIPRNQDSPSDEKQVLKSCLSSGSKKREKEQKKKKKKKRVKFAEDVMKDSTSRVNGRKLYKKEHRKSAEIQNISCGKKILGFQKMPANRVALYSGILKDRVQRMENSY